MKTRLALFMSHPIQYQVPLLRKIAAHEAIDLTTYFFWDFGVHGTMDPEFKRVVKWDIPILEGYRYRFMKNYARHPSSSFWGQLSFGIIPEILRARYDALLIFGWNSFPNWCAILLAPLVGTRLILLGESPRSQEEGKPWWLRMVKRVVLGFVFRRASAIMYIGSENKKFYESYKAPATKLFFMPYAVDNERLFRVQDELAPRRAEFRARLGIHDDRPVILFVGKLFSKKRPMDLLHAFARVRAHTSHASALLYVGDGEQRAALEAYVREHDLVRDVHFVGFRNQTELPEYYLAADCFVLPSGAGETWGLVVNEAMCFGLPVVVSDVVGCGADLVQAGENGFIVPLGDVDALARALSELVNDAALRARFGAVSRMRIKGYSHEEDVKALIGALRAIC